MVAVEVLFCFLFILSVHGQVSEFVHFSSYVLHWEAHWVQKAKNRMKIGAGEHFKFIEFMGMRILFCLVPFFFKGIIILFMSFLGDSFYKVYVVFTMDVIFFKEFVKKLLVLLHFWIRLFWVLFWNQRLNFPFVVVY